MLRGSHVTRIKMLKSTLRELDLRTAREPAKVADKIYSNPKWLGLMARIRKQRGNACAHCQTTNARTVGDHIIEINDGGAAFDAANVQLLCWPCHTKKTNQRRAERQRERLSKPS